MRRRRDRDAATASGPSVRAAALRWLTAAAGFACTAIGLFHLVLGAASVPGEGAAGPTVDSRERFYAAIFVGYGSAWLWAWRQSPVPSALVRVLAGLLLVGGLGRVLSMISNGAPHWFQIVLTVVELVFPPLYLVMATADENDHATRHRAAPDGTP